MQPLVDCSERLFAPSAKPKDADEPEAIELLVDCLIAFLERSSAFLRTIASQAFTTFAGELTPASLDHLVDVSDAGIAGPRLRSDASVAAIGSQ